MSPPILTNLSVKISSLPNVTMGQKDTRTLKRREIDCCHIYCLIRDAIQCSVAKTTNLK